MKKNEKIAVIGLGYVGLPLALLAERKGYDVVGVDIDEKKVTLLKKKKSPFLEESVEQHLQHADHITFTTVYADAQRCGVKIICVPTPVYENHTPNLEPVRSAVSGIAPFVQKGDVIILESTVNPGVCDTIVLPILEEKSGLRGGRDFYLAHCPERINPGDTKWNVENINRVIGSLEPVGLEKAARFYESILTGSVMRMGSLKEAEAVKVVENSFRDINIAFVNELARSFARLGIDVVHVIDGAATKPFSFMAHYPGCGVGGHCIPVDPYYLIEYAQQNGFRHDFLRLARQINNGMPKYVVRLVQDALNEKECSIKGSTIAVLGLAYKPEIDDCRESPAFDVIRALTEKGARVKVFDPYVPAQSTEESLEAALNDTRAVVITTAHRVFQTITPATLIEAGVLAVVDGRNCLLKEEYEKSTLAYRGIGR